MGREALRMLGVFGLGAFGLGLLVRTNFIHAWLFSGISSRCTYPLGHKVGIGYKFNWNGEGRG